VAIFSELDWVIIAGVGAFLLFGDGNGQVLRQLGRYYGRLMRLKQELLTEFTAAAELPPPTPGQSYSLRQAFLEVNEAGGRVSGIPAAVVAPPRLAPAVAAAPTVPVSPAPVGPEGVWARAEPSPDLEVLP